MSLILVADAHSTDRSLLCSLLQDAGHQVLQASNGCGAASLAHDELPDVVILAVDLPLLDGPTAARLLKGSPTTREIPIFAITTGQRPADAARAREAGCDEVLTTPLEEDDLFARVRARLDARPAAFVNSLARRRQLGSGLAPPMVAVSARPAAAAGAPDSRLAAAEQALASARSALAESQRREAELTERLAVAGAESPDARAQARIEQLQSQLELATRKIDRVQRAFALLQGTVREAVDSAYQELLFQVISEDTPGYRAAPSGPDAA